jgi:hypothetical protein
MYRGWCGAAPSVPLEGAVSAVPPLVASASVPLALTVSASVVAALPWTSVWPLKLICA